jgi:replicative DNA helicase
VLDKDYCKGLLGERARQLILDGLNIQEKKKSICCMYHNDKNPSMSWFKDGNCYRCHVCKETLDIYRYLKEYEHLNFVDAVKKVGEMVGMREDDKKLNIAVKKEFARPNVKTKELSQEAIDCMAVRKINKETLDFWKVEQCNKYNIISQGNEEHYIYKYFQDNVLEYVTYRFIGKSRGSTDKGGCEKNTKAILWGMDNIDKTKPVVITEGQPDAMCIWQSGYKNVVSIPAGAQNMNWIDHCWEWLQECDSFIFWRDNDQAGYDCAIQIEKRLSNVTVIDSGKYKDANELMYAEGVESVIKLILNTLNKKPKGLLDVSEMQYTKVDYSQTIETGFYEYDSHVYDWKTQEITVIFGRDNEGKTTIISQMLAHCLEQKVKTFLYSGEMSTYKIQHWLYRQLVGNDPEHLKTIHTKYGDFVDIKDETVKKIKEWHSENFYLFDVNEYEILKDINKFFDTMAVAANRYGVKLFVIDNLMSVLEENADSLYSDQANFVQMCKNFARKYDVHIVLLAHPNKTKEEIYDGIGNLTKRDISGSKNISNKADNIISIERNWDTSEAKDCDLIMTSLKDRETGQRKILKYNFSLKSLRFYNATTKESVAYSWNAKAKETENKLKHEEYSQDDVYMEDIFNSNPDPF